MVELRRWLEVEVPRTVPTMMCSKCREQFFAEGELDDLHKAIEVDRIPELQPPWSLHCQGIPESIRDELGPVGEAHALARCLELGPPAGVAPPKRRSDMGEEMDS